jgi:hypothetical protein
MINTISASWVMYVNIAINSAMDEENVLRRVNGKVRNLKFKVVKFLDIFSL